MINLKKARLAKGMTQEALAQAVFVVRQTISNIECGLNLPSVDLAKRLAEVLEVDWTLFYEG